MKSLTTKLMLAAVALVAASAASAQTLKFDVPFAFQAGGKAMPAGTYRVNVRNLGGLVVIQDARWSAATMALPITHIEGKEETAKLVFQCSHRGCALAQVWPGYSEDGLTFKTPKLDRYEEASLTVIRARVDAAE